MSCILVVFVVVQILFHSSFSALVVEASRSWCGIGMLDSFFRSVAASLAKESAFSFPSVICLYLNDRLFNFQLCIDNRQRDQEF